MVRFVKPKNRDQEEPQIQELSGTELPAATNHRGSDALWDEPSAAATAIPQMYRARWLLAGDGIGQGAARAFAVTELSEGCL
jgi:hypothetical protein